MSNTHDPQQSPGTNSDDGVAIFGAAAAGMADLGLAVIPVGADKRPRIGGFNHWKAGPGPETLERWSERFPNDNIGVLAGLSGLLVADVDEADQVEEVSDLLGPTPLQVRTSRGAHLYYRAPDGRPPASLRALGLKADLISGSKYVVAPPSRHSSGARYEFVDADWSALRDLPEPRTERLEAMLADSRRENAGEGMRQGSRGLHLNDRLCARVGECKSSDELLQCAHELNQQFPEAGLEPLDDAEVVKRAASVWLDFSEGTREWKSGRVATARLTMEEIRLLARAGSVGCSAQMLLCVLRMMHGARVARGQTFAITPKAMACKQVIPGWTRQRYERARDVLLEAGFLTRIREHSTASDGRRRSAQYTLASVSPEGRREK
ncbi:MAG: bifunctional DNA primase/polymerase [Pseudomonadota bacterium]